MHTYYLDSLTNSRSKEKGIKLDNDEYHLLAPNFFTMENQNDVVSKLNLKSYHKLTKDPWKDNYSSLNNMILALRSQSKAYSLIKHLNFKYYVYLRPDVNFLSQISSLMKQNITDNMIIVPDFHGSGGYNDRFAICSPKTVHIYERFGYLKKCGITLHSESILKKKMIDAKVNVKTVKFYFQRIRANGNICDKDKKWNKHS